MNDIATGSKPFAFISCWYIMVVWVSGVCDIMASASILWLVRDGEYAVLRFATNCV